MRRSLVFPISTQHYDDPAEETVAIDPSNELIPHVCVELCLLLYGLLDSILLFDERQTFKVRIELRDEEHTYSVAAHLTPTGDLLGRSLLGWHGPCSNCCVQVDVLGGRHGRRRQQNRRQSGPAQR